jgi:hypothetical protein
MRPTFVSITGKITAFVAKRLTSSSGFDQKDNFSYKTYYDPMTP